MTHTPGPWLDPISFEWLHEPQRLLTDPDNARMMGFAPEMFAELKRLHEKTGYWVTASLIEDVEGAAALSAARQPEVKP